MDTVFLYRSNLSVLYICWYWVCWYLSCLLSCCYWFGLNTIITFWILGHSEGLFLWLSIIFGHYVAVLYQHARRQIPFAFRGNSSLGFFSILLRVKEKFLWHKVSIVAINLNFSIFFHSFNFSKASFLHLWFLHCDFTYFTSHAMFTWIHTIGITPGVSPPPTPVSGFSSLKGGLFLKTSRRSDRLTYVGPEEAVTSLHMSPLM